MADITGTADDDRLTGTAGADTIAGLGGDDVIVSSAGDDEVDGNGGFDTLDFSDDPAGVTVNLGSGSALDGFGDSDTLSGIEAVIGSAFDDSMTGGGAAFERFYGGAGDDSFVGGAGTDLVTYADDPTGVRVDLEAGSALDRGAARDLARDPRDLQRAGLFDRADRRHHAAGRGARLVAQRAAGGGLQLGARRAVRHLPAGHLLVRRGRLRMGPRVRRRTTAEPDPNSAQTGCAAATSGASGPSGRAPRWPRTAAAARPPSRPQAASGNSWVSP